MADTLNPLVYWGQKDDQIFLKVDLRDVTDESLDVTEDSIKFEAYGVGQKGRNRYEFDLDFYLPVEADSGKYKKTDREFQIQIKKKGEGEVWPRLTQKQMKYPWLKIDFDKFIVEDDSENEDEKAKEAAEKEMMEKIEKDLMLGVDSTSLDFKVSYLFLYNMFQFVGYTYVCAILQYHFMKYGIVAKNQAFESVGAQLMVCQVAAILEILHPLLGLVKTGVFAPLMQVLGRNFILFVIIFQEPRLQDAPVVWYLFLTWSAVELIRYPFYMLSSVGMDVKIVTWLRYSAWVVLYPLGFLFEGTLVIMAIPLFEETGRFNLQLPNEANMSFNFSWFLHLYLILLAFGAYSLLNHMYRQRKSKLGKVTKTE
ncbi:hypothetical protein ACJMK2_043944 [Sinanodonta woodiana]|uniref:Very-long-chain (3R)-3-hydroxyacyl-CoA dehydratase n=1 Tax=Sinanodonta woodiana TaxID=1069815 RepID=A0ABD3W1N6_SINWO